MPQSPERLAPAFLHLWRTKEATLKTLGGVLLFRVAWQLLSGHDSGRHQAAPPERLGQGRWC